MADTSIAQEPYRVNYKSDFDFILPLLARSLVNPDAEPVAVGWPAHNWTAKLFTERNGAVFTASCIDGVCTNCFNDNNRIHVVCHRHGLSPGMLHVEFYEQLPDTIYPGGKRLEASPQELNIEIVRGPGDSATTAEVPIVLPYVMLRYADLTEEEKAELQSPATEAAKLAEAGELRRMANEQYRHTNEEARKTAETLRQTNEGIRQNKVELWQTAEDERKLAEKRRKDNEASRGTQEDMRVTGEGHRERAENVREENEVTRQTNETWRSSRFAELAGEMESAAALIETWQGYINTWSTDENTARANEVNRQTAEATRQSNELKREKAEADREEAETKRESAEESRAGEFATWQDAIAAKQDALATTEDLQISNNVLSLTEKGKQAVFDDLYLTAAGMYGEIDYTHTEDGVAKPYKLNGLWLTYEEAQECYVQTTGSGTEEWAFSRVTARTNMPPRYIVDPATWSMKIKAIAMATNIEVLNLMPNDKNIRLLPIGDMRYAFYDSWIRVINGVLDCQYAIADSMKTGLHVCKRLESVQLKNIKQDTSLRSSSKLSLESVEYMVANAASTTAITITVHPDVYAKLTGDTTNEAAAALTPEELAQWQQVLADAVAKNISFATL